MLSTELMLKVWLAKMTLPFVPHCWKALWIEGTSSTACPSFSSDSGYSVQVLPSCTTEPVARAARAKILTARIAMPFDPCAELGLRGLRGGGG